ncbi:MAG: tetratricopeptide repeat protein [Phycisphaeraceae bacterium]|nr:tetratricopeptide repeat protein [Phycisphaeraceae bacterium]
MKRVVCAVLIALLAGCSGSRSGAGAKTPSEPSEGLARAIKERAQARARAIELASQAEHVMRDKPDEAVRMYREAVTLWPNFAAAWHNLGTLLLADGDLGGATQAFTQAADADPQDPRPLANLGLVKLRQGWNAEAYDAFLGALERDPNHGDALRGAVQAAFMLQRADDEVLSIIRRAQMLPNSPEWEAYLRERRLRVEQQIEDERGFAGRAP